MFDKKNKPEDTKPESPNERGGVMSNQNTANLDLTLGTVCHHEDLKVEVVGFNSVYQGTTKSIVVKVRRLSTQRVYSVSPHTLTRTPTMELH